MSPQLCYYQALEFAIERGLQRVEAGAQGEHKLQRVGLRRLAGWLGGQPWLAGRLARWVAGWQQA